MPALPFPPTVTDVVLPPFPSLHAGGDTIARLLARRGLISSEQLTYARRVQAKLVSARPLIKIFKEPRLLSNADLGAALKENPPGIRLANLLVKLGHIGPAQLEVALARQQERGMRLKRGDIPVEHGFLDEPQLVELLASQLGFPFVVPQYQRIDRDLLCQMPPKLFSRTCFLPVEKQVGKVAVAFADPLDREDRAVAERIFGRQLLPAIASRQALREAAERHRSGIQRTPAPAADTTVIGLVNSLLDEAMQQGVSDIHVEPLKDRLHVRFRRDGVLVIHREFDLELAAPITTRLKVMAEAGIAECCRHQDGRRLAADRRLVSAERICSGGRRPS